jgi:hypothetical protein
MGPWGEDSEGAGSRTQNLRVKSPLLYQLSYAPCGRNLAPGRTGFKGLPRPGPAIAWPVPPILERSVTSRLRTLLAVVALAAPPTVLAAQSVWLSPAPPPAIRIVRETAHFGTSAAHIANERAWVAALRSKKVPVSYVGTIAASGAPEFWFFGGAETFAGLEQIDQAYQGNKALLKQLDTLMVRETKFVTEAQTILATYRPDMSYRPMFIAPETRHFWITTFSVHPGREEAFTAVMKAYVTAYGAANVAIPWVTYQMVAGGPNPTYYLIIPMASYGTIDADLSNMATVAGKFASPSKLAEQFAGSTDRVDTEVLTISPLISYVPESFANQDKAFWNAK